MRCCTLAFLLVALGPANAQIGREEIQTDSGTVMLHHFAEGGLSTSAWMDVEGHHGRSSAYDRSGKEIFGHNTRTVGGLATVDFTYHPNGGVRTVEVNDKPEGGDQFYRSITTFDERGNRMGTTEEGNDTFGKRPRPGMRVLSEEEYTVPPGPDGRDTANAFLNEVFVVNNSGRSCEVDMKPRGNASTLGAAAFILQAGDTMKVARYRTATDFRSPVDLAIFTGTSAQRNGKLKSVTLLMMQKRQVTPAHRNYYYHVAPYGGQYGIGFGF